MNPPLTPTTKSGAPSPSSSSHTPLWAFGALLVILLVGLWPRAANLDGQILWIDEDLTYLAVEGIMEHGVPELPSGTVYSRGFLYSYVVAAFTSLGGLDAMMLRLPSVLFSLTLIYMTFYLGREVGGSAVGLVAAAILAVSPWDIHYARMARMYELLSLFVVVIVYLGMRYHVRNVGRVLVPMLVCLFVAAFVHRQAALLAPLFLVPFVIREPRFQWRRTMLPVAAIAAGVLAITAIDSWAVKRGPQPLLDEPSTGIAVPIIGAIDFNETRLWLVETFHASPAVALIAVVIGLVVAFVTARHFLRAGSRLGAGAAFVMGLSVLANQITIAIFWSAVALKLLSVDAAVVRRRNILVCVAASAVVAVVVFAALLLGPGAGELADRQLVRSWFCYPVPWPRLLLLQHPGMMLGIVATSAWLFLRSLKKDTDQAPFYLVCSVWLTLFLMGLMPVHYFAHRYTFFMNPLMVTLFALGAIDLVRLIHKRIPVPALRWVMTAAAVAIAGALGSTQINPREAYALPQRSFGYNFEVSRDRDVTASFHYDFTGPAEFVRQRWTPGDVIIARDPTNLYPYLPNLDFVVSGPYDGHAVSAAGDPVDWYLGIPYVEDVDALNRLLNETRDRRRWIIYTRKSPDGPNTFLSTEQLEYLDRLDFRRAYTSRDGLTVVLELPATTRTADEPAGESRGGAGDEVAG